MTATLPRVAPATPMAGDVVDGRYRLLGPIGRGASAVVWTAEDERLQRIVALKLFVPGIVDRGRQQNELELMVRLSHPGLVSVFDAGSYSDAGDTRRSYLVLEFIAGGTLRDRLADGALPADRAASIGAEVAGTLGYVHARGVVHRDIKPANILLTRLDDAPPYDTGVPLAKLADLGVARMVDGSHLTEPGTTVGTANYISPEQLRGHGAGPASDVYSLGLVLLETLTGQMTYPGSAVLTLGQFDRTPPIPARLGTRWCELLAAMCDREPANRPTASEAAVSLQERAYA